MIYSKSKEETSKLIEQQDLEPTTEIEQTIAGNCSMLMESKLLAIYWFTPS